jgi:hypothetical protein
VATKAIMSRGLGRIERMILALIEDKRAGKNGYAAEALAVAVYQSGIGSKRPPTRGNVLQWPVLRAHLRTSITTALC